MHLAASCGCCYDSVSRYNKLTRSVRDRIKKQTKKDAYIERLIKCAKGSKKPITLKQCAKYARIPYYRAQAVSCGNHELHDVIRQNYIEHSVKDCEDIIKRYRMWIKKDLTVKQIESKFGDTKGLYYSACYRYKKHTGEEYREEENLITSNHKTGYNALLTMRLPGYKNEH